jgi:hypothetical protein
MFSPVMYCLPLIALRFGAQNEKNYTPIFHFVDGTKLLVELHGQNNTSVQFEECPIKQR